MAPNPKRKRSKNPTPTSDSGGIFTGMVVFMVDSGVQARRLQIWRQKLGQMGAAIEDRLSGSVTHVFAVNWRALRKKLGDDNLASFKGRVLLYQWLEDSLGAGERLSEDRYVINEDLVEDKTALQSSPALSGDSNPQNSHSDSSEKLASSKLSANSSPNSGDTAKSDATDQGTASSKDYHEISASEVYNPPDLNRNVTDIFKRMIDIYRALGDDRRCFSYYKAIPVIEKLPFKIESSDQIKHLPAIGKSLQDHIMEILTTGKFSKLEHFEQDEKVRTISLFGEVWGVGPATALKLYEKGHRTLKDLENDESLTKSQRLGLKYFDDIKTRIPRHEVAEMEKLLQEVAESVLTGVFFNQFGDQIGANKVSVVSGVTVPEGDIIDVEIQRRCPGDDNGTSTGSTRGVVVVCAGSYRRGKSSCGDMDVVITHPDGNSHKGFMAKFVQKLKEINFLREDLVFSTHSEEGTDSGVDTYFGLCTFPGRELRHRIDLKVYPRDIYAFGLIAWTGNDTLNRRLRLLAESKGFRLDDTGLFPATSGSGGKRGSKGVASLHMKTEEEVFEFLGFPWLEPHHRNL